MPGMTKNDPVKLPRPHDQRKLEAEWLASFSSIAWMSAARKTWISNMPGKRKTRRLSRGHLVRTLCVTWCYGLLTFPAFVDAATAARGPLLKISVFAANVSPPLNEPVGLGFVPFARTVEHPLLAKGVVLEHASGTVVLCAIDWCEFHNDSFRLLQSRIAEAAQTSLRRVTVHCLHQHTAPSFDTNAQILMLPVDSPRRIATAAFLKTAAERIAGAVGEACKTMQPVTHIGTGQARIVKAASSRRIRLEDGSIAARMSSTKDRVLQDLPEGRIDPWLKTVTFFNGSRPIVRLHYYATHPQTFYGDRRLSYDVPGIVRERLQQETGVFQVYFNGCGGDVAFGKYNDGTRQARDRLVERLYRGVRESTSRVQRFPVTGFDWSVVDVKFGSRREPEFSSRYCRRVLADPKASTSQRLKAAITLAWNERVRAGETVPLYRLAIGPVQMVHLPGEPFVEYQLAAQKMAPRAFVAVAGFGDCGMSYIGGDGIFTDRGGYEQTWALAGPCEDLLLGAIRKLLSGKRR